MATAIQGTLQRFITPSGTFICTLTNNGYKYLTLNLVRQVQALKVPWTLCIFCADRNSYTFFSREGIPCRLLTPPIGDWGTQISPFGTRHFQILNRKKLEVLSICMSQPEIRTGIYLDGDIAVYRDFVPDIEKQFQEKGTQYLFQCDEKGREACSETCPNFCTGFIAWRYGAEKSPFEIATEADKVAWAAQPEDQVYVNTKMKVLQNPSFATLPRLQYPNGMFASFSGIKDTAFLLHYNWLVGGSKVGKMKANGDWIIPY